MSKSTHFLGQPILSQLLKYLNRDEILQISRSNGGERYVKSFDAWAHLCVMLYAVIMRFDSIREITSVSMLECRKLGHLGISKLPRRSTLSDANARRPEHIFGAIYGLLYEKYKSNLSSDSQNASQPAWMKRLQIIDSTTISLFSNLIFKSVGRNPKTGKKKGGIKVHANINANEGVPCDVQFTSAATHDHFMLSPDKLNKGDLLAIDRAYIDYEKFEELTRRGVIYVTKMKKNLTYFCDTDIQHLTETAVLIDREQRVVFTKQKKDGETIKHRARIITYYDEKKKKYISLLTNDFNMSKDEIIAIYRKRWLIESLFKQIKQNFPLRYFYGESENAIKIQVWVVLIANLLLSLLQRSTKRSWSFSGLATVVRITLMYYINITTFLEHPERDWEKTLEGELEEADVGKASEREN